MLGFSFLCDFDKKSQFLRKSRKKHAFCHFLFQYKVKIDKNSKN